MRRHKPIKRRQLTAALSFRSVKDLTKQHSAFLNKVTLGFECEVSAGDLANEDRESHEIDYNLEQNLFEGNFSYDENDYLDRLNSNTSDIHEILDRFEITPIYGFVGIGLDDLKLKILALSRNGYKVVALPMKSGHHIMEEPNIENYNGNVRVRARLLKEFLDDARLINVNLAINRAEEILKTIKDIDKSFPVIASISNSATVYVTDAQSTISTFLNVLKSPEAQTNEEIARKAIYKIGESLYLYNKGWLELYKVISNPTGNSFAVFDEAKNIVLLNVTKYNQNGLLSPLLEWTDLGEEQFQDDYDEAKKVEYDIQWESHLEDVRNNADSQETDNSIVTSIANRVAEYVDSNVKEVSGYHEGEEFKGKYTVVEKDSSIEPPGAEIVSPVFTGVNKAFEWLDKVFDMIDDTGMQTNKSTGFHVNIGTFKSLSHRDEGDGLDYAKPVIDMLKLAVLSGDRYLLDQFGRLDNTYAKSLDSNIKSLASSGFDFRSKSASNLRETLLALNKVFISNQSGTDINGNPNRYRTVNMQHLLDKGYIEFRIAGGSDYHADKLKVKKAIYRYLQLCIAACDPQAYFKEYMVELHKRFVDNSIDLDREALKLKQPRPKNIQEALYILRAWNSKYHFGKEAILLALSKGLNDPDPIKPADDSLATYLEYRLEILSTLNQDKYKYVDTNILLSMRMLLLNTVDHKPNPRQFLANWYRENIDRIKHVYAPKLYKNKPQWVKYLFTGSGILEREITAMVAKPKKLLVKKKPLPVIAKPNYQSFEDATSLIPEMIANTIVNNEILKVLPKRAKDTAALESYLTDRIIRIYDHNETWAKKFKSAKGRDYAYMFMRHWASSYIKRNWSEKEQSQLGQDFANGIDIRAMSEKVEASDSYTNKTDKVKLIYYANRSTAQTCKPGQTVKGKAGYGKRTRVKTATPEQVKQLKAGKWLRDREDGKKHNDKGSKTSRYRPQLAAKQKAARKRRLAASEGIEYKDFIKEVFGKVDK